MRRTFDVAESRLMRLACKKMKVIFGWDGKFNLAGKLLRVGVINLDGSDRPIGLHCLFFRPLFLSLGRQNRT